MDSIIEPHPGVRAFFPTNRLTKWYLRRCLGLSCIEQDGGGSSGEAPFRVVTPELLQQDLSHWSKWKRYVVCFVYPVLLNIYLQ